MARNDFIPSIPLRVVIKNVSKTITIELEKVYPSVFAQDVKYLFKVSHEWKGGKKKPTHRWYNYGEQPKKYDKYFEQLIDDLHRLEKDRLIEFLRQEIRLYYHNKPWFMTHPKYKDETMKALEKFGRLIAHLQTV